MFSETDEGLLHVIIDHITLAIMPQIAVCLLELEEIEEENPDEEDARPVDLATALRQVAEELSEAILQVVHSFDGVVFIPTVDDITEIMGNITEQQYEEDDRERTEGFLGFIQEITGAKDEDEDDA